MGLDAKGEDYIFDDGPYFQRVNERYEKLRSEMENDSKAVSPTVKSELAPAEQVKVSMAS